MNMYDEQFLKTSGIADTSVSFGSTPAAQQLSFTGAGGDDVYTLDSGSFTLDEHNIAHVDLDGDGTEDVLSFSVDVNEDGVGEAFVQATDHNGDGVLEVTSINFDLDGDFVPDVHTHPVDHDGDGIIDRMDIDIDGDGTWDGLLTDIDADGMPQTLQIDLDGDGTADVSLDISDLA